MFRWISRLIFKIWGWKITGDIPRMDKYLIIVAPHTSNWDFIIGVLVRSITGIKVGFVAKKELFFPPLSWYLKWMGGVPVDRSRRTNFVDMMVEVYNSRDQFATAITPEGTRKYVERWRTGFWHIAKKAGIPIIPAGIDYAKKEVHFFPPFYPGNSPEEDIEKLKDLFRPIQGKYPEQGVR